MEAKIERLRAWLCRLLGCPPSHETAPEPELVTGPSVTQTRHLDHTLETFRYDVYDIEIRIFKDLVTLAIFIGGQRCLNGWFKADGQYEWQDPVGEIVPSYKTRLYLKQYAQERFPKE